MNKKIGGQLCPLPSPFSQNRPIKFMIAVLFIIVERPNSFTFGYKMIPPSSQPEGRGLWVIKYALCSRIIFVIGKYAYIFGWEGIICWQFLYGKIFYEERSFQGVNLSGEIVHLGNLPEFLCKIRFVCLTFSFPSQFYALSCYRQLFDVNFHSTSGPSRR